MTIGKRLAVLALLALGGCEFLAKHVRIESDEHSPFSEERKSAPIDRAGGVSIAWRLPLKLDGKDQQESK